MPLKNDKIKNTNLLTDEFIENIGQDAPKFLLRCMKELGSNKERYSYGDLVKFMVENHNNDEYYKGQGIKSLKNLSRYWGYSCSKKHTAKIDNFETLFIINNS